MGRINVLLLVRYQNNNAGERCSLPAATAEALIQRGFAQRLPPSIGTEPAVVGAPARAVQAEAAVAAPAKAPAAKA